MRHLQRSQSARSLSLMPRPELTSLSPTAEYSGGCTGARMKLRRSDSESVEEPRTAQQMAPSTIGPAIRAAVTVGWPGPRLPDPEAARRMHRLSSQTGRHS